MSGPFQSRNARAAVVLACVPLFCFASRAQSSGAEFHQSYELSSGAALRISNPRGNIRISGWDQPRAEVRAVRRSAARGGVPSVEVRHTRSLLELRTPDGDGRAEELDYDVRIPADSSVEQASSTSGSIVISGLRGKASASSTSGDVEASGVAGGVSAVSTSGRVRVSDTGPATVRTTSGAIHVARAAQADVESTSGSISAVDVSGRTVLSAMSGSLTVEKALGPVLARSVSGGVRVTGGTGTISASSTSSGVTVVGARGRIEARTTSGSVRIEGATSAEVDARSTSGSVYYRGSLESGGRYELETLSGGVTLVLPAANCGFDLVAKTFSGAIETDFDIRVTRIEGKGATRRLEGVHGRGCARVRATSFSGSVLLRANTSNRP